MNFEQKRIFESKTIFLKKVIKLLKTGDENLDSFINEDPSNIKALKTQDNLPNEITSVEKSKDRQISLFCKYIHQNRKDSNKLKRSGQKSCDPEIDKNLEMLPARWTTNNLNNESKIVKSNYKKQKEELETKMMRTKTKIFLKLKKISSDKSNLAVVYDFLDRNFILMKERMNKSLFQKDQQKRNSLIMTKFEKQANIIFQIEKQILSFIFKGSILIL